MLLTPRSKWCSETLLHKQQKILYFLLFIVFLGFAIPVAGQSVKIDGPEMLCSSTFATFDANPQGFNSGSIEKIEWDIPNATFIVGHESSTQINNRNVNSKSTLQGGSNELGGNQFPFSKRRWSK